MGCEARTADWEGLTNVPNQPRESRLERSNQPPPCEAGETFPIGAGGQPWRQSWVVRKVGRGDWLAMTTRTLLLLLLLLLEMRAH